MMRILSTYSLLLFFAVDLVEGKDETAANLIAGKQVESSAKLTVGDKLVGVYEKKNYIVEVRQIKANNMLDIVWVATGEKTDDVSQTELYYIGSAIPTRKMRISPLPEAYRALDKNADGQIGLYEWDRAKYAEFKKLDKNHDGFLTPQELAIKTSPVVVASSTPMKEADGKEAKELPNPGNLVEYNTKANETLTFTVTGKIGGNVWGTGTYATDSDLAAVAVHAGVLKVGATGPVQVTITQPVEQFTGSVANEVTSLDRTEAGPGYTVK